ncbi:hypothetical protein ACJIZ3_011291 [Penstemon smallii]|uniref:Uncharacterized protein n=1 Tax=Penstemon smallii TaxID=265156 RepID=A0ABD3UIQ7_9LAMI
MFDFVWFLVSMTVTVYAWSTCITPWHAICLTTPLQNSADASPWECPDCSNTSALVKPAAGCGGGGLVEKICAIECDESMTDKEKAKRQQELLSEGVTEAHEEDKEKTKKINGAVLDILGDKFNCSICMKMLDRPVSVRIMDYSLSLCFCVFVFSMHLRK